MEVKNKIVLKYRIKIVISDFGLSQKYLDENNNHVEPGLPAQYGPGTVEFMSINAHQNQILSRRDDIEGIGYLILYFLQGTLPWTEDLDNNDYHSVSDVVQQKKIDFKVEVCLSIDILNEEGPFTIFKQIDLSVLVTRWTCGRAGEVFRIYMVIRL